LDIRGNNKGLEGCKIIVEFFVAGSEAGQIARKRRALLADRAEALQKLR
jgi:hypothetical protein